MRRYFGWAVLSMGLEAAVVAVGTSIMIEHQKGNRDAGCNAQKVCTSDGYQATQTIDSLVPWNTASWFIAIAGVGAGVALVGLSPPGAGDKTAIKMSPAPAGLTLGVERSF
jgi:hypothetical protein